MKNHWAKRLLALLTALALCAAAAGCTASEAQLREAMLQQTGGAAAGKEEEPGEESRPEVRLDQRLGYWEGNVYKNEWVGFRLTLPEGWTLAPPQAAEEFGQMFAKEHAWQLGEPGLAPSEGVYYETCAFAAYRSYNEASTSELVVSFVDLDSAGIPDMTAEEWSRRTLDAMVQYGEEINYDPILEGPEQYGEDPVQWAGFLSYFSEEEELCTMEAYITIEWDGYLLLLSCRAIANISGIAEWDKQMQAWDPIKDILDSLAPLE